MTLDLLRTAFPPPWHAPGARRDLRARLAASGRRMAVVDDDPTGTQTAHGSLVLLAWDDESLRRAVADEDPLFFVSTNSRSLDASRAVAVGREVGAGLARAAARARGGAGAPLTVISRSDSTLRGHFPGEVDALAAGLGAPPDLTLVVPAFFEGGRYTAGDIHWVAQGSALVPAARTEFARDPTFGYRHSDLALWAAEKAGAPEGRVLTVSLQEIRGAGPAALARRLAQAPRGAVVICNALAYEDLEVIALAMEEREAAGARVLCRSAASFVKARAGLEDRPLLDAAAVGAAPGGCLVVAGSYVGATTRQLTALLAAGDVEAVELDLEAGAAGTARAARRLTAALGAGRHGALFTSRTVDRTGDFLARGARIMAALCETVRAVDAVPSCVVAKGGITSIEVARAGLGARDARVAGQVLPGVPLWRLGTGARWPSVPYVVFPGNVGGDDALREVLRRVAPA
jgi:uncharacterized protein YgbK (DUF1537 family)